MGQLTASGPGKVFLVETLILGAKIVSIEDVYID
jgi:hypothetical protein